jgi:ataxia telangiectasia mutated family protein
VLALLAFAVNDQLTPSRHQTRRPRGRIGQASDRFKDGSGLIEYLLLIPTRDDLDSTQFISAGLSRAKKDRTVEDLTLASCISEMEIIVKKLPAFVEERQQGFTIDVLRVLTSTCIVNSRVASVLASTHPQAAHLETLVVKVVDSMMVYLSSHDCEQKKIDQVLLLISEWLPTPSQLKDGVAFGFPLALGLADALKAQKIQGRSQTLSMDTEFEAFESQSSAQKSTVSKELIGRDFYALHNDWECFRVNIGQSVAFIAAFTRDSTRPISFFLEQLMSTEPVDLAKAWPFLIQLLDATTSVDDANIATFLAHAAQEFLESYAWDRCESVLISFLDILAALSGKWADEGSISPIQDAGLQIYDWFLKTFPEKANSSPRLLERLVSIAGKLLQENGPQFQPSTEVSTVQNTIFKLVSSTLSARWACVPQLSKVFEHYTLGEHDAVFQEIFHQMGLDGATEGMAIWLFMLAELGSAWPTLQRRIVYYLFEWPGLYGSLTPYASFCTKRLAAQLSLRDEQELFRLFAPQLLFTWSREHGLAEIAYATFGYASLGLLLGDIEDEVIGQAIASGSDTEIQFAVTELGGDLAVLFERNFAKVAAYSICLDPRGEEPKSKGESRMRSVLGEAKYAELFAAHYPQVLAIVLACMRSTEEDHLIKFFARDASTRATGTTLTLIRDISHSNVQLVKDQQPNFRTILVSELLGRICRRIGRDPKKLWTPSLYVYVLRFLLYKIHPALGSLHASAFIRRIRVFIALSERGFGERHVAGYALEMTLNSLQPFVGDSQCAEDTIGIVQHLMKPDGLFLANIKFVCSYVVSSLVSLRLFLNKPQDSTTQESHHRNTLSRAAAFRLWLQDWSAAYVQQSRASDSAQCLSRFEAMVLAASNANQQANAKLLTPESVLLKELLLNRHDGQDLLTSVNESMISSLFLKDFEVAPSFREDFLGHDLEAFEYARDLVEIGQQSGLSENFQIWVGRVLGRANHGGMPETRSKDKRSDSDSLGSIKTIVKAILDILPRGSRTASGLVEDFLREISSNSDCAEYLQFVPDHVASALRLATADPVIPRRVFETLSCEAAFLDPGEQWVRTLAVSLAAASNNHFIKSMTPVLHWIDGIAEQVFAPLIHLILADEMEFHDLGPVRSTISQMTMRIMKQLEPSNLFRCRALLNVILELRHFDPTPGTSLRDRDLWLDLDYVVVARAAEACEMHTAALLFAETAQLIAQDASHSQTVSALPEDLLMTIYKEIDEPDSFYGVHKDYSLVSVMKRLDYELDGFKGLLFHGAKLDSEIRRNQEPDDFGMLQAFSQLNLNGATLSLLQNSSTNKRKADQVLQAAQKLEQWDMTVPDSDSETAILFQVFQALGNAVNVGVIQKTIDSATLKVVKPLLRNTLSPKSLMSSYRLLGVLEEIDEVVGCRSLEQVEEVLERMTARTEQMSSLQ